MGAAVPSEFQQFVMSPNEIHVATTFHHLQKQHFHNLRAEYAVRLMNLVVEGEKYAEYFREQAYLKGCIDVLGYLATAEAEPNPDVENLDN